MKPHNERARWMSMKVGRIAVLISAGIALADVSALLPAAVPTVIEFQPRVRWGGRSVAVTVNPVDPQQAIVATERGGLFRTFDGGDNWHHLDRLPMGRMRDVKYASDSPSGQTVVIATGAYDGRLANRGGIWRSTDGGDTWSKPEDSNPDCSETAGAYGIAFGGFGAVYVGTDCGFAISRNYGATWRHFGRPSDDPTAAARAVHSVAARGDMVDIGGSWGHERFTYDGRSFSSAFSGVAPEFVHGIALSPIEPTVLFIATNVPNSDVTELIELNAPLRPTPSSVFQRFNVTPSSCCRGGRQSWVATQRSRDNNPDHFDIYFSDGFQTWRQTCSSSGELPRCRQDRWEHVTTDHDDHNGMAFDPVHHSAQFLVGDGGVHRPTESNPRDRGGNWRIAGNGRNGFTALQIYEVTGQMVGPAPQLVAPEHIDLYIGTQDNHLFAARDSVSREWPVEIGNEGYRIQIPRFAESHVTKVTWYQPLQANNIADPHFNDGAHPTGLSVPLWTEWRNAPGPVIDHPTLIAPLVDSPLFAGRRIYFQVSGSGSGTVNPSLGLYLTRDENASWSRIASLRFNRAAWSQVSQFGPRKTIYQPVQRWDGTIGLQKYTGIQGDGTLDSGGVRMSWADGFFGHGPLLDIGQTDDEWVNSVVFAVDPFNPNRLIAADAGSGHMKFSNDGGANWYTNNMLTALVTNEFRFSYYGRITQARVIAFDPFHRNRVFVGTEGAGIFWSTDGGESWAIVPDSRRIPAISSFFFIDENSRNPNSEVIVSSFARGLWKLIIPPGAQARPFRVILTTWGSWIRRAATGIADEEIVENTHPCLGCRWVAIPGGTIKDILLDQSNRVTAVAADGGHPVASSTDGEPLALELAILQTNALGNFEGCPACTDIVQQGGVIKGLLIEDGQLRSIIAGFGELPSEAEILAFSPPILAPPETPEVLPPAEPYLLLEGAVPSGQVMAGVGHTVTVYGSGFCGDPSCSRVELSIGDRVAAQGVEVSTNGQFQVSFTILRQDRRSGVRIPQVQVTAMQTNAIGKLHKAITTLLVSGAGDRGGEEDTEPPRLVSGSSLDGTTVSLCFSEAITENSGENLQNYSVNNGSVSIINATLRPDGKSVQLSLGNPLPPSPFVVKAANIRDLAGNVGEATVVGVFSADSWSILNLDAEAPGMAFSCVSNSMEITAGGSGQFTSVKDQFTFVFRQLTGDFDVRTRLVPINGPLDSFAGLVAREGAKTAAKSVGIFLSPIPEQHICAVLRGSVEADAEEIGMARSEDVAPAPLLRLKRQGHLFTAFTSKDGLRWTEFAQADTASASFSSTLNIGFVTASGNSNESATVAFRDFNFTEPPQFNPPTLTCPSNQLAWTCSTGMVVNYNLSATGHCGTNISLTCDPPDGTVFPPGVHFVRCFAVDDCQQLATCGFSVMVLQDTNAPVFTCAPDRTVECGGAWDFDPPAATDDCSTNVLIQLVGTGTNVMGVAHRTWSATDACGNTAICTQVVALVDTTAPMIKCPSNVVVQCSGPGGTPALYEARAADNCDSNVMVFCTPPSGSRFALGATKVFCLATDSSGNGSSCIFEVIVNSASNQLCGDLTITLEGTNAVLRWPDGGFVLQEANDVTGPWHELPGATSPYVVPASAARKFYRLQSHTLPPRTVTPWTETRSLLLLRPELLPAGARATLPSSDGDPFYVTLPVKPQLQVDAAEVRETIVRPLLDAIGFSRGIQALQLPPADGVPMPRASAQGLAQAIAFELGNNPNAIGPQTSKMLDVFLGNQPPDAATDEAMRLGEGMTFDQLVGDLERDEIQYPFQQVDDGVPIEHTLLMATRRAGRGITTVWGALFNNYAIVNRAALRNGPGLVSIAIQTLRAARGIDEVPDQPPQESPALLLLACGSDAAGVVQMRFVYRMVLHAVTPAGAGPFILWMDAETGRILKLNPLFNNVQARGRVYNRDPGNSTTVASFEVDPASDGRYVLRFLPVLNRLDYRLDGFNDFDVSIPAFDPTFADFDQAPINNAAAALCRSGGNRYFQQVNVFAALYRYHQQAMAFGIFEPFPRMAWSPVVEFPAYCNANADMQFGACEGYFNAACPNYDPAPEPANRREWLNFAHDNTVIAHEMGHNLTPRITEVRPSDWCFGPGCGRPVGWAALHDLADFWADHYESCNCTGGWLAQNSGGVGRGLYCHSYHDEGGELPRLHQVTVPFFPSIREDHFPEHRLIASGDYADGQIAAAALWQVRLGMRSKSRIFGPVTFVRRFTHALRNTGFLGSTPARTDRGIYRYLYDLHWHMMEQWANSGDCPSFPCGGPLPLFEHLGASTANKLAAGFAKAGLFLIPPDALDSAGPDAVIDIEDNVDDDGYNISGFVNPEEDYLTLSGPAPTFHVWTGPRYRLNGPGESATFNNPAPCNTRFQVEVSRDPAFPSGSTITSPWIEVDVNPTTFQSPEGYNTWTPNADQWAELQAGGAGTQIFYRARTTDSAGGNERVSTRPHNGQWTVPPPYAIITTSGRAEY